MGVSGSLFFGVDSVEGWIGTRPSLDASEKTKLS